MKSLLLTMSLLLLSTTPSFAEASVAQAQKWVVDPAASSIEFKGQHAGNDFQGSFKTWTADIAFDPGNLLGSIATVKIDTGSAVTGNQTYDGSLPSAEWLNIKAFPEAIFQTKSFRKLDGDQYEATATLTIKGISKDITMPFTIKIDGATATMSADLTLDRMAYDVGKDADAKGEWVTKDIAVTIAVKAAKAP